MLSLPKRSSLSLLALLLCALALTNFPAWSGHGFYVDPSQVDLVHILAPPPPPGSIEGNADLQAVLAAQRARTKSQASDALADSELSVFRFADVMGRGFDPEHLPFANMFFQRLSWDARGAVAVAKAHFNRPRPFVADRDVKPVVAKPSGPSYPSGHATFAYVDAIVLSYMVPEKADAIFVRAARFAENRVIGGVHYPTDSEAGRISGSVIANVLLHEPRFLADFARAQAEVRRALELPQESHPPG